MHNLHPIFFSLTYIKIQSLKLNWTVQVTQKSLAK